jgi:N-terminal region of glycosyl transferase group 7/N-terminal domain of galactosyltransferase
VSDQQDDTFFIRTRFYIPHKMSSDPTYDSIYDPTTVTSVENPMSNDPSIYGTVNDQESPATEEPVTVPSPEDPAPAPEDPAPAPEDPAPAPEDPAPAPEDPAPAPEDPAPAPQEDPAPAPEDPAPAPEDPAPAPQEDPAPAPQEDPAPAPEDPAPAPQEDPAPAPEDPAPAPQEDPAPAPQEDPTPAPQEDPTPAPEEDPAPAPQEDPAPAPEDPTPAPEEDPAPAPEDPTPATQEDPSPAPEDPTPAPEDPAPAPEDPAPAPEDPAPAPEDPAPATQEDPAPAPQEDPTPTPEEDPVVEAPATPSPDADTTVAPSPEPSPEILATMPVDQIPTSTDEIIETPPDVIFIIPYRDRAEQLETWKEQMKPMLKSLNYQVLVVNQKDDREFNRGAIKNIGFLYVKNKYPNTYGSITLVFNDVDTYPSTPDTIPNYLTSPGVIKHFYGYKHALGGIVSVNAKDFETLNGFPNYWAWGFEDNMLNNRANRAPGIQIDRSVFYPINSPQIHQDKTNPIRKINMAEFRRFTNNHPEGITSISLSRASTTPMEENIYMVNVYDFSTGFEKNPMYDTLFNSAVSNLPFTSGFSSRRRATMNIIL